MAHRDPRLRHRRCGAIALFSTAPLIANVATNSGEILGLSPPTAAPPLQWTPSPSPCEQIIGEFAVHKLAPFFIALASCVFSSAVAQDRTKDDIDAVEGAGILG
jgi:hypothetical protein